jgi:hypothetical protein
MAWAESDLSRAGVNRLWMDPARAITPLCPASNRQPSRNSGGLIPSSVKNDDLSRRWTMNDQDRSTVERIDGDSWQADDGSDSVPEGDSVTVDPTLADEEVVPADQYEGDLDKDDSSDA